MHKWSQVSSRQVVLAALNLSIRGPANQFSASSPLQEELSHCHLVICPIYRDSSQVKIQFFISEEMPSLCGFSKKAQVTDETNLGRIETRQGDNRTHSFFHFTNCSESWLWPLWSTYHTTSRNFRGTTCVQNISQMRIMLIIFLS